MPNFLQLVFRQKLLILSLLANACLLYVCFSLFSNLKYTYVDYRHFRALPIGTSEATSASPKTPDTADQQKTIVLFGDSRVETWHPLPVTSNTTFINAGVTGETTSEMKRRFERDVVRLKPDYVVIQAGMNDLTASVTKGIQSPSTLLEAMHWNMHYFTATLESKGIDVIVTSIIPNKHLTFIRKMFWFDTLSDQVQQANIKLKQTAESLGADWLNLDPLYLNQNSDPVNELFIDTLHINEKGYALLNRQLEEFLEKK